MEALLLILIVIVGAFLMSAAPFALTKLNRAALFFLGLISLVGGLAILERMLP